MHETNAPLDIPNPNAAPVLPNVGLVVKPKGTKLVVPKAGVLAMSKFQIHGKPKGTDNQKPAH